MHNGSLLALREAIASNLTHPWRLVLSIIILAPLLVLPAVFEMQAASSLDALLADEEQRGTNVLIVENGGGPLDGHLCDAIGAQGGIERAGGVSASSVVGLGGNNLISSRRVFATPGYLQILNYGQPRGSGPLAYIGPALSKEISIADFTEVQMSDGQRITVLAAPESARGEARSRWITMVVPALDEVQECWIEARSESLAAVRGAIPAFFPSAASLRVTALRDESAVVAAFTVWEERSTRWLFTATGTVGGLLVGTLLWPRRHEYALYRILGMSRAQVTLLASAEAMILVVSGVGVASISAFGAALLQIEGAWLTYAGSGLLQVSLSSSVLCVVVAMLSLTISAGSPAHILRERA